MRACSLTCIGHPHGDVVVGRDGVELHGECLGAETAVVDLALGVVGQLRAEGGHKGQVGGEAVGELDEGRDARPGGHHGGELAEDPGLRESVLLLEVAARKAKGW